MLGRFFITLAAGFLWAADSVAAVRLGADWVPSAEAPAEVSLVIRGTGDRNNPVRRMLAEPFDGDRLFVSFRLRYAGDTLDEPGAGDGEFFVLWLDRFEGGDQAAHSGGVPNVGIHVNGGVNGFMVRYAARQEVFVPGRLEGDREYRVVARLSKSGSGPEKPFDRLAVWVDPEAAAEERPGAMVHSAKSIAAVQWIGFSTGRKTEAGDRIEVRDVMVAEDWRTLLGIPKMQAVPPYETPRPEPEAKTVSFRGDVHPILRKHCFECHGGESVKGDLRLDRWEEVLNLTTPRDAASSPLMSRVESQDPEHRMPPGDRGPLPEAELRVLRAWINEGLEWDETLLPSPAPRTDHWSFQPVRRPPVPRVKNRAWVRTPVDAFIAQRQEELGIDPAPPVDVDGLRRRMALDLTGLPVASFEETDDLDAFAERLLASPHHGERWGRHWLDVARWAESNGHQHNRDRDHAWRYRDYVTAAFHRDKPFNEFVREQVAGDELPFRPERIVATGFLAAARYSGNELDKAIQRNDILTDIVNTTGQAFLGLTLECAQCHTHKFDPITIRDYYRLQAFFAKGQPGNVVLERDNPRARGLIARRWRLFDQVHDRIVDSRRRSGVPDPVLVIPKSVVGAMKPDEKRLFNELEEGISQLPQAWAFYSPVSAPESLDVAPHPMRWPLPRDPDALARQRTYLLIRGDVSNRGPEIHPGVPAVFGAPIAPTDRPRLALADWLTSTNNPLTARVWVNRIWQWHFGRGLVESSGDFGRKGTAPTHPELLDWLASELVRHGWSTRHLHRLIVNSNTYRQGARYSAESARLDPDNKTWWRRLPRRLEAEAIRDCVLAVSSRLDPTLGGPSVSLAESEDSCRRAIYLRQKRNTLPHQQLLFDGAGALVSCSRRQVSTVGLQPLYLLNSGFMQRAAGSFADRVESCEVEADQQAALAIRLALGRKPEPEEVQRAGEHIRSQGLESFCLALFNLNEFLYQP